VSLRDMVGKPGVYLQLLRRVESRWMRHSVCNREDEHFNRVEQMGPSPAIARLWLESGIRTTYKAPLYNLSNPCNIPGYEKTL
jgi:hypothetical protein